MISRSTSGGSGRSTGELSSVIAYCNMDFERQLMNVGLLARFCARSSAVCTVAPPSSAGSVVVPSIAGMPGR